MHLIDTHCHLDVSPVFDRLQQILHQANGVDVNEFVIPGVDRAGWDRILHLSRSNQGIHAAPGLHPMYLSLHRSQDLEELEALAQRGHITAIGEIGLDYFVPDLDRHAQQRLFEHQLDIAGKAQLPILVHCRKAHDQVLATVRRKAFAHGGVVHAFSGSFQQANEYIKLGFGIGVGGVITYDRAKKVRKNCIELPHKWLVLETDTPDIIVARHREEPCNLPQYLPDILATLAELRLETQETIAAYTTENARRILGLRKKDSIEDIFTDAILPSCQPHSSDNGKKSAQLP
nr:TatD family hydrolase [uncultured Desulfobulbus sp.]